MNPKKISLKLGSCTKMAARFYGPFEILDKIGPVAYMIALPASMNVHNVFHVSLLLLRNKHQYSIEKPQEKYSTP